MAQQQEPAIHWDQHSSRWNLTLIFSMVVAVLGIITGQFLLVILGLGMGAFSWFTTPRTYLLFRDRMTIVYGMPRSRVISFAEVSHAEVLALPFGHRLRLVMLAGNRMMLPMRDPMAFRNQLEDALTRYRGEQSGEYVEGSGTLLGAPVEEGFDSGASYYNPDASPEEQRDAFYADPPMEAETYTGRVEEAASTSGSYEEVQEPEVAESSERAPAEQVASVSGSFSETAEPDFSGEGRPAYGAEVEIETGVSDKDDEDERPPSPY